MLFTKTFEDTKLTLCQAIEDVETVLSSLVKVPELLVCNGFTSSFVKGKTDYWQICSSQWTVHEQETAHVTARKVLPDIKIIDIPTGLDARGGSEAIVDFLVKTIRSVVSDSG